MTDKASPKYIIPQWRIIKIGGQKVRIVINDDVFSKPDDLSMTIGNELKEVNKFFERRQERLVGEWSAGVAPRVITLNDVLTDQIERIGEFTDVTKLEFGALIMKDDNIVKLDFIQIGESRSVEIKVTRELNDDEWVLGTYHQHPITNRFSNADIQSFLMNKWEEIMILRGANKTILVGIKLTRTKIGEELTKEDDALDNKEIAEKYMFALFRGTDPNNLQLLNTNLGDASKTMSIDNIVKELKGVKEINWEVKKKPVKQNGS